MLLRSFRRIGYFQRNFAESECCALARENFQGEAGKLASPTLLKSSYGR